MLHVYMCNWCFLSVQMVMSICVQVRYLLCSDGTQLYYMTCPATKSDKLKMTATLNLLKTRNNSEWFRLTGTVHGQQKLHFPYTKLSQGGDKNEGVPPHCYPSLFHPLSTRLPFTRGNLEGQEGKTRFEKIKNNGEVCSSVAMEYSYGRAQYPLAAQLWTGNTRLRKRATKCPTYVRLSSIPRQTDGTTACGTVQLQ